MNKVFRRMFQPMREDVIKKTPWNRVLLKKLSVTQLVKKFPAFYGTQRFFAISARDCHCSLS
jgi:hypothetical protein